MKKEMEHQVPDRDSVINDLNVAKLILCNPQMFSHEMRIRIGQAISDTIALLKDQQKGEGKSPTWKKGKAFCGNCGGCLENKEMFSSYHVSSIRFCKWCGMPVDWSNE